MTQPKLDSQGLIAALCATATWGMTGIFVRWLPGWSPFLILVGRFLVAIAVLLPFLLLLPGQRQSLLRASFNPLVWGLSLPVIGASILGITAFQMAPVGEATLLFRTSPLFIIGYKWVTRSPVKKGETVGIFLAAVGVSLILLPKLSRDSATSWDAIAGYLMALGAASFVAVYASWLNALAKQNSAPESIHIVVATLILGSILSFFCAILLSNLSIGVDLSRQVILVFLEWGILATALPLFCYSVAAQRLPIVLSTAMLLLEPVFAVLFAAIALQEIPSLWFGIGSLFVCRGLLLIARESDPR
jgi:drug/metabolite transporter (DMT)-like permease